MKKILGIIVLVVVAFSAWSFWNMDGFKSIEPKLSGRCETIPGTGSAEDMAIDREANLLFISAADRLGKAMGQSDGQGQLIIMSLDKPLSAFTVQHQNGLDDFRPHGISFYRGDDGRRMLFAINHRRGGEDTVEVFQLVSDDELLHIRTIKSPLFESPNDLVAVGPEQFYIANDSGASNGMEKSMETMGLMALSKVVYFDGSEARAVVERFPSGGGINASADGSQIYVSGTSAKAVLVYDRDPASGALTLNQRIDLDMAVDNIDVAADGSLWVAGHPKVIALVAHFSSGGEKPAPSQVYRIPVVNGVIGKPLVIHSSTGEDLSASSVAVAHNGRYYLGGITPRKFLVCPWPAS